MIRIAYLIFGLLFMCHLKAKAQWQPCAGPTGGKLDKLLVVGDTIFAGNANAIFKSVDNGNNWVKDQGMPVTFTVNKFLYTNRIFLAATDKGVFAYSSTDKRWAQTNLDKNISDIIFFTRGNGTDIYITDGIEIYRSPNNGITWPVVTPNEIRGKKITALGKLGNEMYVATTSGLFTTFENRMWWKEDTSTKIKEIDFSSFDDATFIDHGDTLFLASSNARSILYMIDKTSVWVNITSNLTSFINCWGAYSIVNQTLHLSGCFNRVFSYNNTGNSWTTMPIQYEDKGSITAIAGNAEHLFMSYFLGGLFRYNYQKKSIEAIGVGLTNASISGLDKINDKLFAGTLGGVYQSMDNGISWKFLNSGLKDLSFVRKFVLLRDTVFAAVLSNVPLEAKDIDAGVKNAGVYFLAPGKMVWDSTKNIPSNGSTFPLMKAYNVTVVGDSLIASTSNAVHVSSKGGKWNYYGSDKASGNAVTQTVVSTNGYTFNNVFGNSVYRLKPNAKEWEQRYYGLPSGNTNFFLFLTRDKLFVGTDEGLYVSNDFAEGFTLCENGIQRIPIRCIVANGNDLFAGGDNYIFWSNDGGVSWKKIVQGLRNDLSVQQLTCDHDFLFAGTNNNSVWKFPIGTLYRPEILIETQPVVTATSFSLDAKINANGYGTTVLMEFSDNALFNSKEIILPFGNPVEKNGTLISFKKTNLKEKTSYFYRIIAINNAGSRDTSETSVFTTKSYSRITIPQDLVKEIKARGPNFSILQEDAVDLNFSIVPNSSGTKVFFSHRALRSKSWSDTLLHSTSNNFIIRLSTEDFDPLGIEYKIILTPAPGYSSKISADTFYIGRISIRHPQGYDLPALANGPETKDYNLISFPIILDNKLPREVFKSALGDEDYDKTKWRLLQYVGSNGNYKSVWEENPATLQPGPAYWFAAREIKGTLNTGPGNTVANDPMFNGNEYKVGLAEGYNLIGNPYPFDVSWDDIKLNNLNTGLGDLIGYEKQGATLVKKYLSNLNKYGGGYVYSNKADTLKIPAGSPIITNRRVAAVEEYSMAMQFSIVSGFMRNELAALGTHPNASINLDLLDLVNPPLMDQFPQLVFTNGHELVKNIEPEFQDGQFWEFNLHGAQEGPSSISWKIQRSSPHKKLWLVDLNNNHVKEMHQDDIYFFTGTKKLRVYYGTVRYIQENILLKKVQMYVYPNPADGNSTINFTLPHLEHEGIYIVTLSLHDITGKYIRTIDQQRYAEGTYIKEISNLEGVSGAKIIELETNMDGDIKKYYTKIFFK